MLDFSDAAYQFFPAKPSPLIIYLCRKFNQIAVLPGKNHRIRGIEIQGDLEAIKSEQEKGTRLLFVANHSTHSDPQFLTEIHRRMGIHSCFMAAYDVFLRGKHQAWLMQKMGVFSIDREGSDRKAMSAAIDILKTGDYALNIFPEGNVYLTNDRVTPFLDGTAFIALKAQKSLGDLAQVKVVPISLKFTHLRNPKWHLAGQLDQLSKDSDFDLDKDAPLVESVIKLGTHLLSGHLRRHGHEHEIPKSPDESTLPSILGPITEKLIRDLEIELDVFPKEDQTLVDRIRKVRSAIHQIRSDENQSDQDQKAADLADRAILAFRILAYSTPYLTEHSSVDRYAETVERLCEDYYSRSFRPFGERKALAVVHEPLAVSDYLERAGGKLRDAVAELTTDMEMRVQGGIDELNPKNREAGAGLLQADS